MSIFACENQVKREVLFKYPNGNDKIAIEYTREQKRENTFNRIQYYETGVKSGEGLVINGKRNGEWKYYDEKGNLYSTNILFDDILVDSVSCFYPTSELKRKIIELNDFQRRWMAKDYYITGKVRIETYLIDREVPDSIYIEYYENGKVKEKGKLDRGAKIGEWVAFDSTGQILNSVIESGTNFIIYKE